MSWAVVRRCFHDSRWLFLAASLAICIFEPLFIRAISDFDAERLAMLLRINFVRRSLQSLLGADLGEAVSATSLAGFGFSHPFLYMVTGGLVLAECTRTIVGEIDGGRADLWLSLPVSRTAVYVSSTIVWVGFGLFFACLPPLGIFIATRFIKLFEEIDYWRIVQLYPNFVLMFVATGCLTMCVSAFCTRRARAIAIVFTYLIFSFLLNFLATFWAGVEPVARLGLLKYYEPLRQVRDGIWPTRNLTMLGIIAIVTWTIGLLRYRSRDIPA